MATYSDKTFGYFLKKWYLCSMKQTVRTYGRMELAQAYFPAILPRSAWKKLKMLLMDHPQTASLATLPRRSFLPAEVDTIFSVLGAP
jgi:hypothetical protein